MSMERMRDDVFSTWEADRSGVFQGTPTPGEVLDAFLKRLGKPPVIKSIAEHWSRWEEGEAIEFDDTEFAEWRAACRLPSNTAVRYEGGKTVVAAKRLVRNGTHVVIELLDP